MSKFKDAQKDFIVEEATKLFLAKNFNDVTMSDIAEDLEIGEATLYRYFKKKGNIVLLAAEKMASKVKEEFFKIDPSLNGFERVEYFYNCYLSIFNKDNRYFSFIDQFDNFLISETKVDFSDYAESIDDYRNLFFDCFNLGLQDGSIHFDGDISLFYRTSTLALLSLCKKLATSKDILKQEKTFNCETQIKVLIDAFLYRIK